MFFALLIGLGADPSFTVTNRIPPAFVVTNHIPAVAKADHIVGVNKKVYVAYRQPVGHTHTCPFDGETWDHQKNAGHSCPVCGRQQLVQDRYPRAVQVRTVVNQPLDATPVVAQSIPFTLPQSSSACGPGGCPTASQSYFTPRPLARLLGR